MEKDEAIWVQLREYIDRLEESYLISRCMIRRVQLLTIDYWGNTKEVITPFRPPDVKKGRSEAGKSPRIKIYGSRFRNSIQETLIISTTRNNLPWFNQIKEIKANR
jgi:hypothetical protein